jgi:hypothetical protein
MTCRSPAPTARPAERGPGQCSHRPRLASSHRCLELATRGGDGATKRPRDQLFAETTSRRMFRHGRSPRKGIFSHIYRRRKRVVFNTATRREASRSTWSRGTGYERGGATHECQAIICQSYDRRRAWHRGPGSEHRYRARRSGVPRPVDDHVGTGLGLGSSRLGTGLGTALLGRSPTSASALGLPRLRGRLRGMGWWRLGRLLTGALSHLTARTRRRSGSAVRCRSGSRAG